MKILSYIVSGLLLVGCKSEFIGQYPTDIVAPGKVDQVEVVNFKGGSEVRYKIPTDPDLLYVKAVFERNGKKAEQKASIYNSKIIINGYGESKEHTVSLVAYDRSGNASTPVNVTIHPLNSPIYDVVNSVEMTEDFGGVSLKWGNPERYDVILTILSFDDQFGKEELYEVDRFYTSAIDGKGSVRGFNDAIRKFGYFVRDLYGNSTDTIFEYKKPIFEKEMDKKLFRRWNPPGIPYKGSGNSAYVIENAWNASIGPPNEGNAFNNIGGLEFTFDMGQSARLSRLKINWWNDTGRLLYGENHAKEFEVWGSNTAAVNEDFATWTYLGTFSSYKPSGLPAGFITDEDKDYGWTRGEEWTFPLGNPSVRYLRFVVKETWGKGSIVGLSEITLWGGQ